MPFRNCDDSEAITENAKAIPEAQECTVCTSIGCPTGQICTPFRPPQCIPGCYKGSDCPSGLCITPRSVPYQESGCGFPGYVLYIKRC